MVATVFAEWERNGRLGHLGPTVTPIWTNLEYALAKCEQSLFVGYTAVTMRILHAP